jgi:calcineurin-like phosphoesterase family protein
MIQRYLEDGWKEIHFQHELTLKDGTYVKLSHLPYQSKNGSKYDDRYMEWRLKDEGSILLHGHCHGKYKKFKNMIDVGVDSNNMAYYTEDDIINLIKDKRKFIPVKELTVKDRLKGFIEAIKTIVLNNKDNI